MYPSPVEGKSFDHDMIGAFDLGTKFAAEGLCLAVPNEDGVDRGHEDLLAVRVDPERRREGLADLHRAHRRLLVHPFVGQLPPLDRALRFRIAHQMAPDEGAPAVTDADGRVEVRRVEQLEDADEDIGELLVEELLERAECHLGHHFIFLQILNVLHGSRFQVQG